MPPERIEGVVERGFLVSSPIDPKQPFGACIAIADGRKVLVEGLHTRLPAGAVLKAQLLIPSLGGLITDPTWWAIEWKVEPCLS